MKNYKKIAYVLFMLSVITFIMLLSISDTTTSNIFKDLNPVYYSIWFIPLLLLVDGALLYLVGKTYKSNNRVRM